MDIENYILNTSNHCREASGLKFLLDKTNQRDGRLNSYRAYWQKMALLIKRIVFLVVVISLVRRVATAPFSTTDLLNLFGNPIKDIKQFFFKPKVNETHSGLHRPKMIEVPKKGVRKCKTGLVRDIYGVCRDPWWPVIIVLYQSEAQARSAVYSIRFVTMDAKTVLLLFVLFATVSSKTNTMFNFVHKLDEVSKLKETSTIQTSQIIRVPEIPCGSGFRRDSKGKCREIF